jgi:hypothetical protein
MMIWQIFSVAVDEPYVGWFAPVRIPKGDGGRACRPGGISWKYVSGRRQPQRGGAPINPREIASAGTERSE